MHQNELHSCHSGNWPGHDAATGFPVRSHHLSGRLDGQRLRVNSFTTIIHTLHDRSPVCQEAGEGVVGWEQLVGFHSVNIPSRRQLSALFLLLAVLLLLLLVTHHIQLRHRKRADYAATGRASSNWSDRFGDGKPDFMRLTNPPDQAAFRRWFTLIAEYQAIRPREELPPEIIDCASLLRFSYREALKRHDDSWFLTTGIEVTAPPGEILAWRYPNTPLGAALFRVKPGAFEPDDVSNGAFAQFADARTLVERNAYFVSRDAREAQQGDLLFFRQFGQSSPWHSMIIAEAGARARVVYDTGPDHGKPGELRRVLLSELLDHPQPQWRPIAANPNFLGVYRWNILRGNP